ncbi:MAG TPA: ATP-binding protein [Trebonia sp.]|nr:ATP-binding protein [Trebonia sp.]
MAKGVTCTYTGVRADRNKLPGGNRWDEARSGGPLPRQARGSEGQPAGAARWPLDGARPESVARQVVTSLLSGLGVGPDRCDDAELAIQELVVNARLHAPGPHELHVAIAGDSVTFAVADGGDDHAAVARLLADPLAEVPFCAERGRGLRIVAALFPGDCGSRRTRAAGFPATGKHVWFRVAPIKPMIGAQPGWPAYPAC